MDLVIYPRQAPRCPFAGMLTGYSAATKTADNLFAAASLV